MSRSFRLAVCILALLPLVAAGPAEARYSKSPFVPNAFPKPVINTVFSIPLDPAQLVVVYPAALERNVKKLQAELAAKCGREIPFASADSLGREELAATHLIVIGNILDNKWALELYKQRRAFADAQFPGKGGYIIHPAASIWSRARNVLVIGASSEADLVTGFEGFVNLLSKGAQKIDAFHALKTSLKMPAPPTNAAEMLEDTRKNALTSRAPYGAVGEWGLNYFITGDKAWAELFRDGFAAFYERAKTSGDWVPEPWTNIYFNLRGLFLAWGLIDDDPFFTEADRKMIEETLWGFTIFVRNMILLDEEIAPAGEPRQNHTSHMGFGLYYAYNYYMEKYGISGLEPMAAQFKLAFDLGQGNAYRPNDDAAGYQFATPGDYYTYALAQGDESALKAGRLRQYMNLLVATTDNHGEPVSFGDVGGYSPRESGRGRSPVPHFARLAAWYYRDGQYQWIADWLANPDSPGNLANGDYAADVNPEPPKRYEGITSVMLDESSLLFASRRAGRPSWFPDPGKLYFDKIAMRRNFDPQDEYLCLEGTSFFSHGHFDGNTVTRLTWKDRIWLFDLHYINFTPRYHSGLVVTFEGRQDDPPLLTSLDSEADFPSTGFLQTTSSDFNRADWTRHIVWRKGRYFLFLDTVKALETGDYRIDGRWRTRGDIELKGNVLKVLQGDKVFFIKSADATPRSLVYEPDGYSSTWNYPYGGGKTGVLLARRRVSLGRNAVRTLANLMYATDAADRASIDIARIGDGLYSIKDRGEQQVAGTDAGALIKAGIATDSGLFLADARGLSLAGLTYLRSGDVRLRSSARVHLDVDLAKSAGTLIVPAGGRVEIEAQNIVVGTAAAGARGAAGPGAPTKFTLEPGIYQLASKWSGTAASALVKSLAEFETVVEPAAWAEPLRTAGISAVKKTDLPAGVTSFCQDGETLLVGDAQGGVVRFRGETQDTVCQIASGRAVGAIKAADIDGDGSSEIIAGDDLENLYCYKPSGSMLWSYKMTPINGSPAVADIAVGDLDGQGRPTILVATKSWKLYAYHPDGKVRWEAFVYYHPGTKVGILSGEKQPTVVAAGNVYHTPLNVVSPADGSVLWHTWEQCGGEAYSTTDYCGFYLTGLVFMDTDGDGIKEIIFGTKFNRIFALNSADGATKWSAVLDDEVTVMEKMTDPVTGDEFILAGTDSGEVVKLNRRGRRVRALTLAGGITDLEVVNYPAQKRSDILASTRDGAVVVFDQDFEIRASASLGDGILGLAVAGKRGVSNFYFAVADHAVALLEYRPYFLRKSRDY